MNLHTEQCPHCGRWDDQHEKSWFIGFPMVVCPIATKDGMSYFDVSLTPPEKALQPREEA